MRKARAFKKFFSVLFSAMYIHVNVAWSGNPALFAPSPFPPVSPIVSKTPTLAAYLGDQLLSRLPRPVRQVLGVPPAPIRVDIRDGELLVFHRNDWQAWNMPEPYIPPPRQPDADLNQDFTERERSKSSSTEKIDDVRKIPDDGFRDLKKDVQSKSPKDDKLSNLKWTDVASLKSLDAQQRDKLREAFKNYDPKDVRVSVMKSGDTVSFLLKSGDGKVGATLLFEKNKTAPTMDLKTPTAAQPVVEAKQKAANQKPDPKKAQEVKEVRAAQTAALTRLGYQGDRNQIVPGSLKGDGKFVRDENNQMKFQGSVSWDTKQGIHYEAKADAKGGVLLEKTVGDVGPEGVIEKQYVGNKLVGQTTYHNGDKETTRNGELIHFEANDVAITRETFVKMPTSRPTTQPGPGRTRTEPIDLSGSRGQYVVREGRIDSTFEMKNNKVELMTMKDNMTDTVVAKRLADGTMMRTASIDAAGGIERRFQVLGGPTFDSKTGRANVAINSFHYKNEVREFTAGRGAGGGEGNANHLDKNINILSMGGGKFVKVAQEDGASMAGLMSLSGSTQHVSTGNRENVQFLNAKREVVATTVSRDKVKVTDADRPGSVRSLTIITDKATRQDRQELKSLGVVDMIPIVKNGAIVSGELKMKDGRITEGNISFRMATGAAATLEVNAAKSVLMMDNRNIQGDTAYHLSMPSSGEQPVETKITIPGTGDVIRYDLNNGFLPKGDGQNASYGHLNGVRVENDLGKFALAADPQTNQIAVTNVQLNNDGKTTFSGQTVRLREDGAGFDAGRVFFKLDGGLGGRVTDAVNRAAQRLGFDPVFAPSAVTIKNQMVELPDNQTIVTDIHAQYMTMDGAGNKSLSAELTLNQAVTSSKGSGGGSMATPGVASRDLLLNETAEKTVIAPISGDARVAALVTEVRGPDGNSTLQAQMNVFTEGATNITAGKDGFSFGNMKFQEGMSLDLASNMTMVVQNTAGADRTVTDTAGTIYRFTPKTTAALTSLGPIVLEKDGQVTKIDAPTITKLVDADAEKLSSVPDGLKATVNEQRETVYRFNQAPEVTKKGSVSWETTSVIEIPMSDGGKITLPANMKIETAGPSLLHDPTVKEGRGKMIIEGPENFSKTALPDGATRLPEGKLNIGGAMEARVVSRSRIEIGKDEITIVKPVIEFKVTNPDGFKSVGENGRTLQAAKETVFQAASLGFTDISVVKGQVDIWGDAVGTERKQEGVIEKVTVQSHAILTPNAPIAGNAEEVSISGQKGAVWTASNGSTVRFDTAASGSYAQGRFTLNADSSVGTSVAVAAPDRKIDGTQAVFHVETSLTITENNGKKEIVTNDRFRMIGDDGIKQVEGTFADGRWIVDKKSGFEGTGSREPLRFDGVAYDLVSLKSEDGRLSNQQSLRLSMTTLRAMAPGSEWNKNDRDVTVLTAGDTAGLVSGKIRVRNDRQVDLAQSSDEVYSSKNGTNAIVERNGVRLTQGEDGRTTVTHFLMTAKDDDGKSHRFTQGVQGGIDFEEKNLTGFTFDGQSVNSTDVGIETVLETKNLGKTVGAFTNQGFQEGEVAYVPEGKATFHPSEGASFEMEIKKDSLLSLRKTVQTEDGPQTRHVLTSSLEHASVGSIEVNGQTVSKEFHYLIDADSYFQFSAGGAMSGAGTFRARLAFDDEMPVGSLDKVNVLQGAAGGADSRPDAVTYVAEGNTRVMTGGRVNFSIGPNKEGQTETQLAFKSGTVFFRQDSSMEMDDPRRMDELQQDGSFLNAAISGKSTTEEIGLDIMQRFAQKEFKAGDYGGGDKEKSMQIVVFDRSLKKHGTYSVSPKVIKELRTSSSPMGPGMAYSEVDSGRRSLVGGTFIWAERKSERVERRTVRGEFIGEAKEYIKEEQTIQRYRQDGKSIEKVEQEKHIADVSDKIYVKDADGETKEVTVSGRMEVLYENGSGVSSTLTTTENGKQVSYDLVKAYQTWVANESDSKDKNFARRSMYRFIEDADSYIRSGKLQNVDVKHAFYNLVIARQQGAFNSALLAENLQTLDRIGLIGDFGAAIIGKETSQIREIREASGFQSGTGALGGVDRAMQGMEGRSRSFARQVDVFLGDLTGAKRIMKIDGAGSFALSVGEQTLNVLTFGGGNLALGGGKAIYTAGQVGRAGRAINAVSRFAGWGVRGVNQVEKIGALRTVAGGAFQLYLRSQAFNEANTFLDVAEAKGMSWDTTKAFGKAGWSMLVSEIGWVGPILGKGIQSSRAKGVVDALGFGARAESKLGRAGQVARQMGTVALAGAGIRVGADAIGNIAEGTGSLQTGGVRGFWGNVAEGATIGLVALGGYRLAGRLGGTQTAAEGASAGAKVSAGRKIADGAKVLARNAAIGAGANVAGGIAREKVTGEKQNFVQRLSQGGLMGILVGGGLQAMSNWGKAATQLSRDTGLIGFAWERVKAGALMGGWEVFINSWLEPLAQNTAIGSYLGYGHTSNANFEKQTTSLPLRLYKRFEGTFLSIGALHPFFSFGRIGYNPLTAAFGTASQKLKSAAASRYLLAEAAQQGISKRSSLGLSLSAMALNGAGRNLERITVMPITIKTFEIYTLAATTLAKDTGLIAGPVRQNGEIVTDEQGLPTFANDKDDLAFQFFSFLGFINAPIHPGQSGRAKKLSETMAKANPGMIDMIPGLRNLRSGARAEAMRTAENIRNEIKFGGQESASRILPSDAAEAQNLTKQADDVLINNPSIARAAGERVPGSNPILINGSAGARFENAAASKPQESVKIEGTVKSSGRAGDSETSSLEVVAKASGQGRSPVTLEISEGNRLEVKVASEGGPQSATIREGRLEIRVDGEFVADKVLHDLLKNGTGISVREGQKVEVEFKGFGREDAIATMVEAQSGTEVRAERVAEARSSLGMASGERVVLVDKDFVNQAQRQYIALMDPAADRDTLVRLGSAGFASQPDQRRDEHVAVMAVEKLHGTTAGRVFQSLLTANVEDGTLQKLVTDGLESRDGPVVPHALRSDGTIVIPLSSLNLKADAPTSFRTESAQTGDRSVERNLIVTPDRRVLVESRGAEGLETTAGGRVEATRVETVDAKGQREVHHELTGDQRRLASDLTALGIDSAEIKIISRIAAEEGPGTVVKLHVPEVPTGGGPVADKVEPLRVTGVESSPTRSVHADRTGDLVAVQNLLRDYRSEKASAVPAAAGTQSRAAEPAVPSPAAEKAASPVRISATQSLWAKIVDYFTNPAPLFQALTPGAQLNSGIPVDMAAKAVALGIGKSVLAVVRVGEKAVGLVVAKAPAPADPALAGRTAREALKSDARYQQALETHAAVKLDHLTSGTWREGESKPGDLIAAERALAREGFRVLNQLEVAKAEAEAKTNVATPGKPGTSFADTKTAKEIGETRRWLADRARRREGTMEGFGDLREVHYLREVVEGVAEMDAKKVKALRDSVRGMNDGAAKTAMNNFVQATDELIARQEKGDREGAKKQMETVGEKLVEVLDTFGLDLHSTRGVSESKVRALDVLMAERSTAPDRARALGDLFGEGKRSMSDLNVAERFSLNMALQQRHRETYESSGKGTRIDRKDTGAVDFTGIENKQAKILEARGKSENRDMRNKQAALLVQFELGRIAGLAAGGGKTGVFVSGFGMFASVNPDIKGVGELITFSGNEVDKYLGEYQPLARALGMEFVDGRNLAAKTGSKQWEMAYNPEVDAKGETWQGERRLKVVVLDYHSRGFIENHIRAFPGGREAALMRNVRVQSMDEADAQFLSKMSFISSQGDAKASRSEVRLGDRVLTAALTALGYNNSGKLDIKGKGIEWRRYDASKPEGEGAGYRDTRSESIKESDLETGRWFTVTESGDVKVSRPLLNEIIRLSGGERKVSENEVVQTLRALEAYRAPEGNEQRLTFLADDASGPALRPTLVSHGVPQKGQIDSSTMFNVVSVLLYNRSATDRSQRLDTKDIRLSEAGSMATFVQVLQTRVDHRFGATGTPESMEKLSELVIGMRVVNVDPSSVSDYRYKMVTRDGKGQRATALDIEAIYNNHDRSGARGTNGEVLKEANIVAARGLTAEGTADLAAAAVYRSMNGRWTTRGAEPVEVHGAGILVAGRERENKLTIVNLLRRTNASQRLVTMAENLAADNKATTRDMVRELRENAQGEAGSEVIGRFRVIDGRDSDAVVEGIVSGTAKERHIVFVNEAGLRAANYKAGDGLQVDLFMSGFEHMTTESWLQALARVDRGDSRGAVRTVVLDMDIVEAKIGEAVRVDQHLQQNGGRRLFTQGTRNANLLQQHVAFQEGQGARLNARQRMELGAAFMSSDNRARSALFFIGEQTSVQLMKQPLQAMEARERAAGNKKGADEIHRIYREALRHSDKGKVEQGAELQDPTKIGAGSFTSSAETAARFLLEVAKAADRGVVSQGIGQEARMRVLDIEGALKEVNTRFSEPSGSNRSFVQVSESIRGEDSPARAVLDVCAELAERFILPNTSLARDSRAQSRPQTVAQFSEQAATRAGPAVQTARQEITRRLNSDANSFQANPSNPSSPRLLTASGQRLAAAFNALVSMDDDERQAMNLQSIGGTAGNDLVQQAETLSGYENPESAISLAQDLAGLGRTVSVETAGRILGSSTAREDLVGEILSAPGDSPLPAETTDVLQQFQDRSDDVHRRSAQRNFADTKLKDGRFVPTVMGWVRAARDVVSSAGKRLEKVAETPLSRLGGPQPTRGRLLAMVAMVTPLTREERKNAARVIDQLLALQKTSPESDIVSRVSARDILTAVRSEDPIRSIRETLDRNQMGVVHRPFSQTTKMAMNIGSVLLSAAAIGLAAMAPISVPVVLTGAALALKIASYDPNPKEAPGPLGKLTASINEVSFKRMMTGGVVAGLMYLVKPTLGLTALLNTAVNQGGGMIGRALEGRRGWGLRLGEFLGRVPVVGIQPTVALRASMALRQAQHQKERKMDREYKNTAIPALKARIAELRKQMAGASPENRQLYGAAIRRLEGQIRQHQRAYQDKTGIKAAVSLKELRDEIMSDASIPDKDKKTTFKAALLLAGISEARADRVTEILFGDEDKQSGKLKAAVSSLSIEELLDEETSLNVYIAAAEWEASNAGADIHPDSWEGYRQESVVEGEPGATADDLYNHYAGRPTSSEEKKAAKTIYSNYRTLAVESERDVPATNESQKPVESGRRNYVREVHDALANGTVHDYFARATRLPTATRVAQSQANAIRAVSETLREAGVSEEAIQRVRLAIYSNDSYNDAVDTTVEAISAEANDQNRDALTKAVASVKTILYHSYYTDTAAVMNAFHEGRALPHAQVGMLSRVANPAAAKASPRLSEAQWQRNMPFYRAMTALQIPPEQIRVEAQPTGWRFASLASKDGKRPDVSGAISSVGETMVIELTSPDPSAAAPASESPSVIARVEVAVTADGNIQNIHVVSNGHQIEVKDPEASQWSAHGDREFDLVAGGKVQQVRLVAVSGSGTEKTVTPVGPTIGVPLDIQSAKSGVAKGPEIPAVAAPEAERLSDREGRALGSPEKIQGRVDSGRSEPVKTEKISPQPRALSPDAEDVEIPTPRSPSTDVVGPSGVGAMPRVAVTAFEQARRTGGENLRSADFGELVSIAGKSDLPQTVDPAAAPNVAVARGGEASAVMILGEDGWWRTWQKAESGLYRFVEGSATKESPKNADFFRVQDGRLSGYAAPALGTQTPSPSSVNAPKLGLIGILFLGASILGFSSSDLFAQGPEAATGVSTAVRALLPAIPVFFYLAFNTGIIAKGMEGIRSWARGIFAPESSAPEAGQAGDSVSVGDRINPNRISIDVPATTNVQFSPNESIIARQVTWSPDGRMTIGGERDRALRQITFNDAAPHATDAMKETFVYLSRVAAGDPGVSAQPAAARDVEALLADPNLGFIAGKISVAPLIAGREGDLEKLQGGVLPPMSALSDVAAAAPAVRDYVYQLVAYHAESMATPQSAVTTLPVYRRLIAEMGDATLQPLDPQSTGPVQVSEHDMLAAQRMQTARRLWGHRPVPLLTSNKSGEVAVVVPPSAAPVPVSDGSRPNADVRALLAPKTAPNTRDLLLLDGEPLPAGNAFVTAWQNIRSAFAKFGVLFRWGAGTESETSFIMEGNSAVTTPAVNLAQAMGAAIDDGRMNAALAPRVWNAIGNLALRAEKNPLTPRDVAQEFQGIQVDDLIQRLSSQLATAMARQQGAAMRFAGRGMMPQVGVVFHEFLNTPAVPVLPRGARPDASWTYLLNQLRASLDLKVLDPESAEKESRRLARKNRNISFRDYQDRLLALLGPERMIVHRLNEGARTFVRASEITNAVGDPAAWAALPNDKKAELLRLMVMGLSNGIEAELRVAVSPEIGQRLETLRVTVVDQNQLPPAVRGKNAAIDVERGEILIGMSASDSAEESLRKTVGALAHEVAHVYADAMLAPMFDTALGVPSAAEEAFVFFLVSRALRRMQLPEVADTIDELTYRAIAESKDRKVAAFYHGDLPKGADLDDWISQVKERGGDQNHRIVIAVDDASQVASWAEKTVGTGIRVIPLSALAGVPMVAGEAPIQTYARLYHGAAQVKLIFSRDGKTASVVKAVASVISLTDGTALWDDLTGPFVLSLTTLFDQKFHRLVSSQA